MSNFCDYSHRYILVKGTTKNIGTGADAVARQADEIYKQAILIDSASFTDCINIFFFKRGNKRLPCYD